MAQPPWLGALTAARIECKDEERQGENNNGRSDKAVLLAQVINLGFGVGRLRNFQTDFPARQVYRRGVKDRSIAAASTLPDGLSGTIGGLRTSRPDESMRLGSAGWRSDYALWKGTYPTIHGSHCFLVESRETKCPE